MSSDGPAIDLEALLTPIPGDLPAGIDLRGQAVSSYDKIKVARRDADDKQQGRSGLSDSEDKLSPEERASAAREYWRRVRSLVIDAIAKESKDLQLAVWLLEAETYISGFTGTERGLELIRGLLENYWDTLYPPVEDDDEPLAFRAGVLQWIDDRLAGILRGIPLSSGPRSYTLAHYELAEAATNEKAKAQLAQEGRPSLEQFAQVMAASSVPHLTAMAATINGCLAQVLRLEEVTNARFGRAEGPSFSSVRKVLEACVFHVERGLRTKGPAGPTPSSSSPSQPDILHTGEGDIWHRALQLVGQGRLEGLHLAQQHIEAATSGRERFLRQLQLSELCIHAGMHAFAYPILDELGTIIDERRLVTWEDPDVIRRTWSGLAGVCKSLARLHPKSVDREIEAQGRLSTLATDSGNAPPDK